MYPFVVLIPLISAHDQYVQVRNVTSVAPCVSVCIVLRCRNLWDVVSIGEVNRQLIQAVRPVHKMYVYLDIC